MRVRTGQPLRADRVCEPRGLAGRPPNPAYDPDHAPGTYSPQFVYQYEVGGVTHFNIMAPVRKEGEGEGEDWARNIAKRYPKGGKVAVSYFPADPDVATLETGNDSEALYLPGIGLVMVLFSLAVFIFIVPSIAKFP